MLRIRKTISSLTMWLIRNKEIVFLMTLAGILFLLNCLIFYPGYMSRDTINALYQAMGVEPLKGLQPAILPIVWSMLITITGKVSSILIFQLAILWTAIGILSVYAFVNIKKIGLSIIILLSGFLPIIVNISGVIWSDVQMAYSLLLATVLLIVSKYLRNGLKIALFVLIAILIVYAGLLRNNAIFAVAPLLLLYFFTLNNKMNLLNLFGYSAIALFVIITLFFVIRIGFTENKISSTAGPQMDDIVHIMSSAEISRSNISPDLKESLLNIQKCIYAKDIIIDSFPCGDEQDKTNIIVLYPHEIGTLWQEMLKNNPDRYLLRRILVFNYVLFPPEGRGYIWHQGIEPNRFGFKPSVETIGEINRMYVFNFGYKHFRYLYEPWFWLLLNIGMLIYSRRLRYHGVIVAAISVSGILHIMSFIPTGVAADYRYIYWPVLAGLTTIALVVIDKNMPQKMNKSPSLRKKRKTI